EVDDVRAFVSPQHIAWMAVAVQAQRPNRGGFCEALLHQRQRGIACALPRGQLRRRNQLVLEQQIARSDAEAGWIKLPPVREQAHGANLVHATDEAAEPSQRVGVVEFGLATGAALADRETMAMTFD